ncbi:MAG: DUF480 domain-containing protein [Pseudomonadota bacterium]
MATELSDIEIRVLGCLMEKSITTPDQYPMTLNALTNACNQKSSREPVMSLDKGEVQHTLNQLSNKHLVRKDENFKRGVDKYTQRFCNSTFGEIQLESDEFAIVTLLMLRGPQTPGELRARSGRLHSFEDNSAVVACAERLAAREEGPLVIKLPRTPGRRDAEYMHLLGGEIDLEEYAKVAAETKPTASRSPSALEQRVDSLEEAVAELRARLDALE